MMLGSKGISPTAFEPKEILSTLVDPHVGHLGTYT